MCTIRDNLPAYKIPDASLQESCFPSVSGGRNPVVSVVIVNYNGLHFLKDCVQSLLSQTFRQIEIIVVDNASSDNTVEFLKGQYPGLKIIENTINYGFAGGINEGIRHASGSFILTMNNDTSADPHCIEHLIAVMNTDDRTGMCATKMLLPDNRIDSTGICISRSGAAWDRGIFENNNGQFGEREDVFGPCAGAALYRKTMLDEIGLFDEDFFLYMEDVDLAFRARLAGWNCVFVPEAVVYHYHGGTSGVMSDITIYYGNRNILWWPVKNYPLLILLVSLPWMIARTMGVLPYYASMGRGRIVLKSKMDGIAGLPKMWKKRKFIKQTISLRKINSYFTEWTAFRLRLHPDYRSDQYLRKK